MKIIIKTKNFQSSPAIEKYVQKKLETLKKFLKNFKEESLMAEIELGRTTRHHQAGDIFRAEINLSIDGKLFRAESEKENLYAAIDEVRDDLEREIKKFKTKKETAFIRGARSLKKKFGISPFARFRDK
ncbi:ribosome-associated translation inhibitor RaiA [Patescibacteria group bacterium]|nr:ribosome-associated translation inhibitor RaiA [Patescibacteria group bacterium]